MAGTQLLERLRRALAPHYEVGRELASGGMATVFLAQDVRHRRKVAIKVFRSEFAPAIGAERFIREIEITAGLVHPHILPLLDSGEADGLLFYVMPFVEGESLRGRLDREKQLGVQDALQIALEIADALSYAHSLNLLHRDIKPENVLLQAGHAVVADFGIAKAISAAGHGTLTESGIAVGTPAYMSPEQAAGEVQVNVRSDIYSLACILYEMLGGVLPYTGESAREIVAQKLSGRIRPLRKLRSDVSPGLEAVLMKALAASPADRFSTVEELVQALRAPNAIQPTTPTSWIRPTARKVAPLTLAVALAGWWFLRTDEPDQTTKEIARPNASEWPIAVLPFRDVTKEQDMQYVGDMIAERLIGDLSRLRGLTVASWTSSLALRERREDVRAIADRLGVLTLVDGTVVREDGQITITAHVIDASSDRTLFTQSYRNISFKGPNLPDEVFAAIIQDLTYGVLGPVLRAGESNDESALQDNLRLATSTTPPHLAARILRTS